MIELSFETIAAAKAKDLAAITAVVEATEERVQQLANRYALGSVDLREELAQTGRIAVWEGLSRFSGGTVAEFFTFMDRTVSGAMTDARKAETRPGVSRSAAAYFETALSLAGGDPYEAERIAQSKDTMGDRRMTADMAYAARLSWMGTDSLDRPINEDGSTLGDVVAAMDLPAELVTSDDITAHRRKTKIRAVHRTLAKLTDNRRNVLCADFGISGGDYFGGADVPDAELAAQMRMTETNLRVTRTRALSQFREVYLAGAAR